MNEHIYLSTDFHVPQNDSEELIYMIWLALFLSAYYHCIVQFVVIAEKRFYLLTIAKYLYGYSIRVLYTNFRNTYCQSTSSTEDIKSPKIIIKIIKLYQNCGFKICVRLQSFTASTANLVSISIQVLLKTTSMMTKKLLQLNNMPFHVNFDLQSNTVVYNDNEKFEQFFSNYDRKQTRYIPPLKKLHSSYELIPLRALRWLANSLSKQHSSSFRIH